MFKFRTTLLHLTVRRTFSPLESKFLWHLRCLDSTYQVFFFSFNYLTDQALQCRSVYLPSITVLGLYQANCRAGSTDSTAGSGSHGETGKCCQESSWFHEDHSGGRCLRKTENRPCLCSWYWTRTSLQWRLMGEYHLKQINSSYSVIVRVRVVLKRTVVGESVDVLSLVRWKWMASLAMMVLAQRLA